MAAAAARPMSSTGDQGQLGVRLDHRGQTALDPAREQIGQLGQEVLHEEARLDQRPVGEPRLPDTVLDGALGGVVGVHRRPPLNGHPLSRAGDRGVHELRHADAPRGLDQVDGLGQLAVEVDGGPRGPSAIGGICTENTARAPRAARPASRGR